MRPGVLVLSIIFMLGYFGVIALFVIIHAELQQDISVIVTGLIGALTMAFSQVINYWFGSSSASAAKTEIIQNLSSKG